MESYFTINNKVETDFGLYLPLSVRLPNQGPEIKYKDDLSDVKEIPFIKNPLVRAKLSKSGFVVVPSTISKFYSLYKENKNLEIPNFITTDVVLHTFHVLFEKILEKLETTYFYNDLVELSKRVFSWASTQYNDAETSNLKKAFQRISAFFAVGLYLLQHKIPLPEEVRYIVNAELKNVNDCKGFEKSLITDNEVDFTQFIVRGHYTRSETLSRYFLTMMYYGQIVFFLEPLNSNISGVEQTRMALLITIGLSNNPEAKKQWDRIIKITEFIVEKSDDLGINEYITLLKNYTISDLESNDIIEKIIKEAKNLPDPRILGGIDRGVKQEDWAERMKGFRFMGQRFVPDSYFFQKLLNPNVNERTICSGLDIMAILGSEKALELQKSENEKYKGYTTQLYKLIEERSQWDVKTWTRSYYYLWLYSLLPLLHKKSLQYPSYMRTSEWADKELNTALGSWAELRHDTILYAKQAYPTLGASLPQWFKSDYPGVVEANPEVYGRLKNLVDLIIKSLTSQNMEEVIDYKLRSFSNLLDSLKIISEKQLIGEELTSGMEAHMDRYSSGSEWYVVQNFGDIIKGIIEGPGFVREGGGSVDACIADVMTDSVNKKVLEAGIGNIYEIYVITENKNGKPYLTRGGVFSYYEFPWPMTDRLTDEKWQNILKLHNESKNPTWTATFMHKNV